MPRYIKTCFGWVGHRDQQAIPLWKKQILPQRRLTQLAACLPKHIWSKMLSSKRVCWDFLDICDNNCVLFLWQKKTNLSITATKVQCFQRIEYSGLRIEERIRDLGLRTEDSHSPSLASVSLIEASMILKSWQILCAGCASLSQHKNAFLDAQSWALLAKTSAQLGKIQARNWVAQQAINCFCSGISKLSRRPKSPIAIRKVFNILS